MLPFKASALGWRLLGENQEHQHLNSDRLIKDISPLQTEAPSVDNVESDIPQSYIVQEGKMTNEIYADGN